MRRIQTLRRIGIIVASVTLALIGSSGLSEARTISGQSEEVPGLRYTVVEPDESPSSSVVYYLHGGQGSDGSAVAVASMLNEFAASERLARVTVIAVSLGPLWLVLPDDHRATSPKVPQIGRLRLAEELVKIEAAVLRRPISNRAVLGFSMGGINAIELILAKQGLFDRVALVSPALLPLSPYASTTEVEEYASAFNEDPKRLAEFLKQMRNFVSPELWAKVSPSAQADEVASLASARKRLPRALISTVPSDDAVFGGSRVFIKRAREAGLKLEELRYPGAHNEFDRAKVSRFLLESH